MRREINQLKVTQYKSGQLTHYVFTKWHNFEK